MKRLTSYNLGFALQIFAVILLFGYPGCAAIKGEQQLNTGKTGLIIKKSLVTANTTNRKKAGDSLNILHPWNHDITKLSLITWVRK